MTERLDSFNGPEEVKLFADAIPLAEFVVSKGLEYRGVKVDENMRTAFTEFSKALVSDEIPNFPSAWRSTALKADSVESTPEVRRMLQDASFAVGLYLGMVRVDKSQPLLEATNV